MIFVDDGGKEYKSTSHWQSTTGRLSDLWHQISSLEEKGNPSRSHLTLHQCGSMHRFIAIDSGHQICQMFCEVSPVLPFYAGLNKKV